MLNFDYVIIGIESAIIFQCLFSMVYLISFQWRRNRWLVMAFFCLGWPIFNLLGSSHRFGFLVHPAFNNPAFGLVAFMCIYFYTLDLTDLKTFSNRKNLWHFLWPIVLYVYFLFCPIPPPDSFAIQQEIPFQLYIFFTASIIIPIGYAYLIYQLIQLNQQKYLNEFAESNIFITLNWIKWVTFILAFMIVFNVVSLRMNILPSEGVTQTIFLLVCATLSYFSFRQPTLYKSSKPEEDIKDDAPSKYQKIISDEEKIRLVEALEIYLSEEKPYLNPNISPQDIADNIKINKHHLSEILNLNFGKNFNGFINLYRIEEAKKLLTDNHNNITMLAIAYDSGFNSKSSFNRAFKEITGNTPSEYKKNMSHPIG